MVTTTTTNNNNNNNNKRDRDHQKKSQKEMPILYLLATLTPYPIPTSVSATVGPVFFSEAHGPMAPAILNSRECSTSICPPKPICKGVCGDEDGGAIPAAIAAAASADGNLSNALLSDSRNTDWPNLSASTNIPPVRDTRPLTSRVPTWSSEQAKTSTTTELAMARSDSAL